MKKRAEEQTQIRKLEQEEKEIEALYDDQHKLDPVHVGRGGAGNVSQQVTLIHVYIPSIHLSEATFSFPR
jgi:hypothetical protein